MRGERVAPCRACPAPPRAAFPEPPTCRPCLASRLARARQSSGKAGSLKQSYCNASTAPDPALPRLCHTPSHRCVREKIRARAMPGSEPCLYSDCNLCAHCSACPALAAPHASPPQAWDPRPKRRRAAETPPCPGQRPPGQGKGGRGANKQGKGWAQAGGRRRHACAAAPALAVPLLPAAPSCAWQLQLPLVLAPCCGRGAARRSSCSAASA